MDLYSQLLVEIGRFPLSGCFQQLLETLALKTNATRAIGRILRMTVKAEMIDGRGWAQENGPEGVMINDKLWDEGEGGVWFDSRFFWRGRGDANLWNLKVHRW